MADLHRTEGTTVAGAVGSHFYSDEEKTAFVNFINNELAGDPELADYLPIDVEGDAIFKVVHDGMLLAKIINYAAKDTIDIRGINKAAPGKDLNTFQLGENGNLIINSAKSIGCIVINVGAVDISEGTPHLILGLIWQIIKIALLSKITLTEHPELYRLLEAGETIEDLMKLSSEDILIRWVNYHLKRAGTNRRMTNFTSDVKDSEIYSYLLSQICPEKCDTSPLNETDVLARAGLVLDQADRIDGVDRFLAPNDVVAGNHKLNLAFVADLFNNCPALEELDEKEQKELLDVIDDDDLSMDRDARKYRNWVRNLLDINVDNIFTEVNDGLLILKIEDKLVPGCVDWSRVEKNPRNVFTKSANCSYAIEVGRELKLNLINMGGKDFVDGIKKLILGLMWQLLRLDLMQTLKNLSQGSADFSEKDIVDWANSKSKSVKIARFNDAAIKDSKFILEVVSTIEPRAVEWENYMEGDDEESRLMNAKYALTCARRIGACPYGLPEDIVEADPKMMLQLVASIYSCKWDSE